jgi:hypothetical protein
MLIQTDAIGYHGTSRGAVARLLAGDIIRSDQQFEWLGSGFYLWQDSPWRAREWAEAHHGEDAAVVAVRVELDGCLDLLNPEWQRELRRADRTFVAECLADGRPVPVNRDSGYRARDCATINWFCDRAAEAGLVVRSVRAVFEERDPIFEASAIRTQSHVQIAVRDLTAILELEEVTW